MTIVSRRLFRHPRAKVYEAFSDPAKLALWWGPDGFTNAFTEFDLRPGGYWRFTMTGPEGQLFEMEKRFVEVLPGERVVLEHIQPMHRFAMIQTFQDDDGGTLLTWEMEFYSKEEMPNFDKFIAQANEQNFDRLEALLSGS